MLRMLLLAAFFALSLEAQLVPRNVSKGVSNGSLTASEAARIMAETPRINFVSLSPDGVWVIYNVIRKETAANSIKEDKFLQRIDNSNGSLSPPIILPDNAEGTKWCPGSRCVSMVLPVDSSNKSSLCGFVVYDILAKSFTSISVKDTFKLAGTPGARERITKIPDNYLWSPDGKLIVFKAATSLRDTALALLGKRPGVLQDYTSIVNRESQGLFIMNTTTGIVSQLTHDSIRVAHVLSFDWSPDGRSIAVAVEKGAENNSWNEITKLIVVDIATRSARLLSNRSGMNAFPKWSPDGRWIAFATNDEATKGYKLPAIISSTGDSTILFPRDGTPEGFYVGWWNSGSKRFIYKSFLHMTEELISVDLSLQKASELRGPDPDIAIPHNTQHSLSADGRWMAYAAESETTPSELFITSLDAQGNPVGVPRQITNLSPKFLLKSLARVDTISWRSADDKFTIPGLLVTPSSANNSSVKSPLPTLVYLIGGPGMVRRGFARDGHHGAILALAARGYVVLVPNHRGRGGYGHDLAMGIFTGRSRGRLPLSDVMTGVDLLIRRGITDSSRLGILGHSYGGYLTAYAITQTNRFKGAMIHEGGPISLVHPNAIGYVPGESNDNLLRESYGYDNPYDPNQFKQLIEESPIFHANRVKTPTLIEYGTDAKGGGAEFNGRPFYNALRRFNVPSVFFKYDEGHAFSKPLNIWANITRTSEWMDYWVRGFPFPDPVRAEEFNSYKISNRQN